MLFGPPAAGLRGSLEKVNFVSASPPDGMWAIISQKLIGALP